MKSHIYFLSLLFVLSNASAQNYVLSPSDSLSGALDVSGEWIKTIDLKIDIINLTSSDLKLKWKIIDKQILPQWEYSVCDHVVCYSGTVPDSATLNQIAPYDTGFLKVSVYDSITVGDGYVKLLLYSSSPETDTLSYYFSFLVASVPDISAYDKISINNIINDEHLYLNISGSQYTLYEGIIADILGRQLKTFATATGLTVLDVSTMPEGIYFLNLVNENGNAATFKFIKN